MSEPMPKPTDPSIGEAVERLRAVIELRSLPAIYEGGPPRLALAADLRALLSENARLRERVGVLEGALEPLRAAVAWQDEVNAMPSPPATAQMLRGANNDVDAAARQALKTLEPTP